MEEEVVNVQSVIEGIIVDELNELSEMEVGTDKYRTTVDGISKLMDKAIELNKFNAEFYEKVEARKKDDEIKEKQMKEDKKDRLIKNCITGAGIVLPLVVTVWGTLKSLKFEEEGTITTAIGRGFINKLLPKK